MSLGEDTTSAADEDPPIPYTFEMSNAFLWLSELTLEETIEVFRLVMERLHSRELRVIEDDPDTTPVTFLLVDEEDL